MIKKWNILVPIGCRSDKGLSAPVIKRLNEADWCEIHTLKLFAGEYVSTLNQMEDYLISRDHPDLVLITGDRIEMMACAEACFLNHVKIAHFYAGIITNRATFDGIHRHNITLMSDIAFCEDQNSAEKVWSLWGTIGKAGKLSVDFHNFHTSLIKQLEEYHIHIVGISHLDDLEVDESLVPNEPYDLILYNPITKKDDFLKENLYDEMLDIDSMLDKYTLIIESNPDPNNKLDYLLNHLTTKFKYHSNLPRSQFLGLLKNCSRFITNSSCAYYEAPHFLKPEQIIQVGLRNKNRSTPKKLETGASDKIVKILKEYFKCLKK